MTKPRILLVDDEPGNLELFARFLGDERYRIETCGDGSEALAILKASAPDLLVTDLRMPGMDGLELSREALLLHPGIGIILVTGFADLNNAVEAIRIGLSDFLQKPVARAQLQGAVERVLAQKSSFETREGSTQQASPEDPLLLGISPAMEKLRVAIARVQGTPATVLVHGETGTGKELVARTLHQGSPRRDGPFVAVNCAAVAAELLESELFGHERGAFTGAAAAKKGLIEEADGGTFFLDEVGELPGELQAKLLRVLQEREVLRIGSNRPRPVDFRLVAATNRDLREEIRAGRFREDLYYRLNVFPIRTPPLRDRPEDVPVLAQGFLADRCRRFGRPVATLSEEAAEDLSARAWPGNVRELQNLIERLVLLRDGTEFGPEDLAAADELEGIPRAPPAEAGPRESPGEGGIGGNIDLGRIFDGLPSLPTMEEIENAYLRKVLQHTEGNRTAAARILGIHPATLKRKLGE